MAFYCLFEALSFIFLRKLNLVLVKKGALKALTKFTTIVTFFAKMGSRKSSIGEK